MRTNRKPKNVALIRNQLALLQRTRSEPAGRERRKSAQSWDFGIAAGGLHPAGVQRLSRRTLLQRAFYTFGKVALEHIGVRVDDETVEGGSE